MIRVFFCLFILVFSIHQAESQVTEEMLKQQLLERGIDEAAFRAKLNERGILYESLDQVPPEKYAELETTIRQILDELEREKQGAGASTQMKDSQIGEPPVSETVQEVKSSILEGATIEETIAENIEQKQPDLPGATIYGHEIFRKQTLQVFRQADNIKPKENYLLGSGDELTISIYGASIFERTYTIDESGYISPAAMPRIYLKDLTFKVAQEKLKRNFASFYQFQNDQFEVSLRYARTITIGIFGEVFQPGSFTISAINSAFNALVAAGGPTDIGTLRNIRWIRSDGQIEQVDVYQFMSDPRLADRFYLSENDILQVPVAGRIVTISGAVNRPMRYELTDGENLNQLIRYAGDFRPDAYREILQLKRFENDQQKVIDITYNQLIQGNGDFILKNGDQITVRTIPAPYKNYVTVAGTVELPGEYEFIPGMRVSDLIAKSLLNDESERTFAVLRRNNRDGTFNFVRLRLDQILVNAGSPENLLLAPGDQLTIYSRSTFVDRYQVSVNGQVRNPGSFSFDPSQTMRLRDLILMSGGLTPQATDFGYLIRKELDTGQPQYIQVSIKDVIDNPTSDQNLILQPLDVLQIQSKTSFLEDASVSIGGSVRNPGSFTYHETMTLKDLITLANGFRMEAATNRIEVSRLIIRQNEPTEVTVATLSVDEQYQPVSDPGFRLQPYDRVYVRAVPEFEFPKSVSISGEVRFPGPYTLISDNERISELVRRAGGITVEAFPQGATLLRSYEGTGPVVIQLDQVLNNERSGANIILKDGDQINIPKIRDFVSVAGAVNTSKLYRQDLLGPDNRVTVVYEGDRSARYYIEKFAGGLADNGDRRKITVEYPNGRIREAKDLGLFVYYPKVEQGSIVRVGIKDPEKTKTEPEKEPIDWGEVLANAVSQATLVLTLILLIDRAGR